MLCKVTIDRDNKIKRVDERYFTIKRQQQKIKIVGAQRTMYQGLWGIELSMRRILGVRYPKEKPQNGI